jgi:hypothetical protein
VTPLQQLIEKCRRQQHKRKRGIPQAQLPLFNSNDPEEIANEIWERTVGDISEEEAWQEHTAARIDMMNRERLARLTWPVKSMLTEPWATEEETLEEWRSRTELDDGFVVRWVERLDSEFPLC